MMTRFIATIMLCLCSNILWAKGFVVSIHPLYLIAQEVTKGIEKPELLLGNQSGHDIQLTPENRKALQDAELVIWVGKAHEAPLDKILSNKANAVSLLSSGVLATLPLRDLQGQNIPNSVDTHVWLEPNNAVRIAFLWQHYDRNNILNLKINIGQMHVIFLRNFLQRHISSVDIKCLHNIGHITMPINI